MKRTLGTLITAVSLVAGIASAQPTNPFGTAPHKPDLTSKKGVTIGGKFVAWGGSIVLDGATVIAKGPNGRCAFDTTYDLVNIGSADTTTQFVDKLRIDNNEEVAIQSQLSRTAGESKDITSGVYFQPGGHTLNLSIDDGHAVDEISEGNNQLLIHYRLSSCGGSTNPTGGPSTEPQRPDLTSKKGITIGGKFAAWGSSVNLSEKDALSKANGQCVFRVTYDLTNIGTAPSNPAFVDKLYIDAGVVAVQSGLAVHVGESKDITSDIYVKPGGHPLRLIIDDGNADAESNESNNSFIVKYVLDATCK